LKTSFTFDTKTLKFSFTAKNVDLSGLGCPLTVEIEIGDYTGAAEVNEAIVNGSKKPIPIKLMMGVKNALRVDSDKVTRGKKKPNTDQLSIKGGFAVADTGVNLVDEKFVVTMGEQTFTLPAGSFKANKKKDKFTCSKADVTEGGITSATFNFTTCSFTITIKNITIEAGPGAANFSVEFADFSVGVQIVLPANIIVGGSSYEGTWIGQFNLRYIDYTPEIPVERSRGFSITITLKSIVVANGVAFLTVTHANVNDPYFGCQVGGCTPDFGSLATLQVPPENISTVAGPGIVIIFPNGVTLATANNVGEMHMSSDGRIISNSLGVTDSWGAVSLIGPGYETVYLPVYYDIIEKTWAFTKRALWPEQENLLHDAVVGYQTDVDTNVVVMFFALEL
jgi:hypothetical protein